MKRLKTHISITTLPLMLLLMVPSVVFANCLGIPISSSKEAAIEIECRETDNSFEVDASMSVTMTSWFDQFTRGTDIKGRLREYDHEKDDCNRVERRRKADLKRAEDELKRAEREFRACERRNAPHANAASQEQYNNFIASSCSSELQNYLDKLGRREALNTPSPCVGDVHDLCEGIQQDLDAQVNSPSRQQGVCNEAASNSKIGSTGVFGRNIFWRPGIGEAAESAAHSRGFFQGGGSYSQFSGGTEVTKTGERYGCEVPEKIVDSCALQYSGRWVGFEVFPLPATTIEAETYPLPT
ncbi:MAG: hypothetical protein KDD70_14995, partial [Bdellovibrionales bacterium]|nr:hypothetical protein [Bdellovibrionales bacterium]